MVVFEAGKAFSTNSSSASGPAGIARYRRHFRTQSLWGADHVHRGPAHVALRMNSAAGAGSQRDGRKSPPRIADAGRQHRQCVAGRRYASSSAGLRRRLELVSTAGSRWSVSHVPYRLQADAFCAPASLSPASSCRAARGLDDYYRKWERAGPGDFEGMSRRDDPARWQPDCRCFAWRSQRRPDRDALLRTEQSLRDDPANIEAARTALAGDRSDRRHPVHGELSYAASRRSADEFSG